uniref:Uncharacterized protein n=1 Tax=Ascaris lumbricoides TaxID=6252 RepID=A0A0M3I5B6_ASCLU
MQWIGETHLCGIETRVYLCFCLSVYIRLSMRSKRAANMKLDRCNLCGRAPNSLWPY